MSHGNLLAFWGGCGAWARNCGQGVGPGLKCGLHFQNRKRLRCVFAVAHVRSKAAPHCS